MILKFNNNLFDINHKKKNNSNKDIQNRIHKNLSIFKIIKFQYYIRLNYLLQVKKGISDNI